MELTIESIGFEGKAVARRDGLVYFVQGAVPGDRVVAELRKKKRRHREAVVSHVLEASEHRRDPACSYFGDCGGCRWQHLDYAEQVAWKKRHVQDAFQRLAKIEFGELHPTVAASSPFWYRNKMEFSFAASRWLTQAEIASGLDLPKDFALGLHAPGRFDKVIDIEKCWLQSELSNRILNSVRAAALQYHTSPYNTRSQSGFLRNLVVRHAIATKETMVILVTSPSQSDADENLRRWFATQFVADFPELTTAIHAVTDSKATIAVGEPEIIYGPGYISETLLGVSFRISPFSFFQTNTLQAERLFSIAIEFAGLSADDKVWDLYCGAGSIALSVARNAAEVIGIELSESAIADARANAERNGISNVRFVSADVKNAAASSLLADAQRPDIIFVDPPRAGMHPDVVKRLPDFGAAKIVYISCNPTTQARDCALLDSHYRVQRIQPVDMFPNTYHIESVALLERR